MADNGHGFRVSFASHDDVQSFISVFHFRADVASLAPSLLSNALKAGAFPTALAKTLKTVGSITAVTATAIPDHGDPTPPVQDTQPSTVAGAYSPASSREPAAVCGLVQLKSTVSGRGTHGWTYGFPVYDEGMIAAGGKTLGGSYYTQLQAEATALNAVLTVTTGGGDFHLCTFSRARWLRGEATYLFTVSTCVAPNKHHFLRRRDLNA